MPDENQGDASETETMNVTPRPEGVTLETRDARSDPRSPAPLRILHVLGYAGVAGAQCGITGVERIVELLLRHMQPGRFEQHVAYPGMGEMARRYGELGAGLLDCAPRRRYDRVYVQTLARFVAEARMDVVVSHGLRYDFLTAFACRSLQVPHVVSRAVALADEPMPRLQRRLFLLVDNWTLHGCQAIIAVSEASKRRMHETQSVTRGKVQVVPNGVRMARVTQEARQRARRELGIAPDALLLGGIGQLIPRKAFHVLVRAVGRLVADGREVTCVLLGEGPERQLLQQLARDERVPLLLPGYLPDPYPLMGALDIAVLPSLAEGMPVVVLETMGLGVANIATRVAGTPEVIEDGVSGLLVPAADLAALTAALRRLIDDPALRLRLARAGEQRVRDRFSVEAMARGFERCLSSVAQRGSSTDDDPPPPA